MRLSNVLTLVASAVVTAGLIACSAAPANDGDSTGGAFTSGKDKKKDAGGTRRDAGIGTPVEAEDDGGYDAGGSTSTPEGGTQSPPDSGGGSAASCGYLNTCCTQMDNEGYPGDAADCRGHASTNSSATCSAWLMQYRNANWCD